MPPTSIIAANTTNPICDAVKVGSCDTIGGFSWRNSSCIPSMFCRTILKSQNDKIRLKIPVRYSFDY